MEESFLSTLEGLTEVIKNGEEHPVFQQGERDTLVILDSDFGTGGRGKGNRGGRGGEEPIYSE